ncbi:MAG TPA: hypothetical protein VHM89_06570 [Acidimicrobiales bacterium]|nr:hypothetical protein [Acidimicrobiales bacterium]
MATTNLRRLLCTAALPAFGLVAAVGVAAATDAPHRPSSPSVEAAGLRSPCGETEHAGDRACAGITATTVAPSVPDGEDLDGGDDRDEVDGDHDVSGPCDEAEHATDARCAGATPETTVTTAPRSTSPTTSPTSSPVPVTVADNDGDEDLSGPCDEAEHATDPRCGGDGGTATTTTTTTTTIEDNSGPGGGDGTSDNSGPGGGDDDGGNRGPGGGDEDHSGSGGGGGD